MKSFINYFKLFQPLFFVLFAAILIAVTFFLDVPSILQLLMVFVIVMGFTLGNSAFGKWLTHDAKGRKALQRQEFAAAAEEFRKGLECTRYFADDDPRVAQLLDGFAQAQKGLGDYTEAESLSQQALAVQEKAWGPAHYRTMACVVNLGNVYLDLARYDEAKALYERALNIVEDRRGGNHPDVAICLNNMGKVYSDRERYPEAEPFFRRAMEIMESRCKPTHWYVGFLCNNMAYVLGRGGKLSEAETFGERAVAIFEQAGKRDLMLAAAYGSLGHIRYRHGRLAEAEELLQQSYTIQKKLLTRAHPHLASTLHDLARVFMAQQRWQEAEEVCQREVHLCEEYLVPTHPSLARALENYAELLTHQVRDLEAENLRTRAQQVRACFEPKNAAAPAPGSGLDIAIRPPPAS